MKILQAKITLPKNINQYFYISKKLCTLRFGTIIKKEITFRKNVNNPICKKRSVLLQSAGQKEINALQSWESSENFESNPDSDLNVFNVKTSNTSLKPPSCQICCWETSQKLHHNEHKFWFSKSRSNSKSNSIL